MSIFENRSRRNNIRVGDIRGSKNEGWDVTKEKLRKVIKDELDIENLVIERVHRVKGNNNDNENNERNRNPPTVVPKLLHFKDKQDILHEVKSRKIRIFYLKEIFLF